MKKFFFAIVLLSSYNSGDYLLFINIHSWFLSVFMVYVLVKIVLEPINRAMENYFRIQVITSGQDISFVGSGNTKFEQGKNLANFFPDKFLQANKLIPGCAGGGYSHNFVDEVNKNILLINN